MVQSLSLFLFSDTQELKSRDIQGRKEASLECSLFSRSPSTMNIEKTLGIKDYSSPVTLCSCFFLLQRL
jgi:hypothetical protein